MIRILISLILLPFLMANLQTPPAVVRAVLFYSPECGHCHYVIEEVLPPLVEKYGAQLEIIGVDITQPQGSQYFQSAMQKFNLETAGVPFLVIGDQYLMGSRDIPEQFPGYIEKYLAQGGVDYPNIPGLLEDILASRGTPLPSSEPTAETQQTPVVQDQAGIWQRVMRDPLGNGMAIAVLLGMIVVAAISAVNFPRMSPVDPAPWQRWLIPVLALAGFFVAGYLAYVETAQVAAVCGPVGDCNTVQQSEYARVFGILPIGVLGLFGYIAILTAWLVGRLDRKPFSTYADMALLVMTTFGLLFSIYLTFLEPFVIGATCAWCLTSAILMTVLFWLSLKPGKQALLGMSNTLSTHIPEKRR